MSLNYRRIGSSLAAGIASGLLVAAMPAQASTPEGAGKAAAASNNQATPSAKPAKPQRYCIVEAVTGSRIEQRTCLTKEEWADRGVDITHPDQ